MGASFRIPAAWPCQALPAQVRPQPLHTVGGFPWRGVSRRPATARRHHLCLKRPCTKPAARTSPLPVPTRPPTPTPPQVLRREIRKGRRLSAELSFCSDLTLGPAIGRGGYGTVYSGTWRNTAAAIKVGPRVWLAHAPV